MNHFTGGVRAGSLNASYPFARLECEPDGVLISSFLGSHHLAKGDVLAVSEFRGFLSRGVRFQHTSPNAPSLLVFWFTSPGKVLRTLESMGFQVTSEERIEPVAWRSSYLMVPIVVSLAVLCMDLCRNRLILDAILNAVGLGLFVTVMGLVFLSIRRK